MSSKIRGTFWSVTIYPKEQEDLLLAVEEVEKLRSESVHIIPGWILYGQVEMCPKTNRYHLQGALKTPQVSWEAVKKIFWLHHPHIEVCKDKAALMRYVNKTDSRVASLAPANNIPSLFEYSDEMSKRMPTRQLLREQWEQAIERVLRSARINQIELPLPGTLSQFAYSHLESMVAEDIRSGRRGIEFIVQNPLWITTWRHQILNMIDRNHPVV